MVIKKTTRPYQKATNNVKARNAVYPFRFGAAQLYGFKIPEKHFPLREMQNDKCKIRPFPEAKTIFPRPVGTIERYAKSFFKRTFLASGNWRCQAPASASKQNLKLKKEAKIQRRKEKHKMEKNNQIRKTSQHQTISIKNAIVNLHFSDEGGNSA
ncbi:hypothetical protein TRVL_05413 [Trypanosoma vivax]|nr:hypothetical protein TRVL_05413 [Trypanosoma vivax]